MGDRGITKQIKGKLFISTRPAGRSAKLRKLLEEQGAKLIEMPMIDIRKSPLSIRELQLIKNTKQFNWIVFTSSNGVRGFFEQLKSISGSYKTGGMTKIAVIGKDTGMELSNFDHDADYVSTRSTGKAFSAELHKMFRGGNYKILLPAGNLARSTIEDRLSDIADVVRVNVYNTEMPGCINYEALKCIEDDKYEMIIFTSSSGFNNFCLISGDKINIKTLRIACIGSTTAESLARAGVSPLVIATKMNSRGIVEAITDYYKV